MGFSAGSMAALSLASQVGGGVMSTIGSYSNARSERLALVSQARAAETNARLADLSAQNELAKGQHEVGSLILKAGKLRSKQRAALAANGVVMGEGSAAEMLASTDLMKDIDISTIEANAARSAWGYRTEAVNYQNQAAAYRAGAKGISPGMVGASSLLSSAGKVASSWYAFNETGAWGNTGSAKVGKAGGVGSGIFSPRVGYAQSYEMLRA